MMQMVTNLGIVAALVLTLDGAGLIDLDNIIWATRGDVRELGVEVAQNSSEREDNAVVRLTIQLFRLRDQALAEGNSPDIRREILNLERRIREHTGLYCEAQIRIYGNDAVQTECRSD